MPVASLTMLALAWSCIQDTDRAASARRDFLSAPRDNGNPTEVTIGFYILDFARITARDESFEFTGYLELRWIDPAQARQRLPGATRKLDPAHLWTPRVFFDNAVDQLKQHHSPEFEADDSGRVSSWVIVSGKFSTPFDLRRFPFETQVFTIRIGAFDDESVVRFVTNNDDVMVDSEAFVTDRTIGASASRAEVHQYAPDRARYARFVHTIEVSRRSTFYVRRDLVPLSLLTVVSFAAFWFEPSGLQPQNSTCMASLIALVAFNFAIDFSLPKVGYLKLIDKYALAGFSFVAAAVVAVALEQGAVVRDRIDLARTIRRTARVAFPLGCIAAVVIVLTL